MTKSATATGSASLWATYELSLEGPGEGNPFQDVELRAVFRQGDREVRVNGFYDGGSTYKLRFLPDTTGTWHYDTRSNAPALDGFEGSFEVAPAQDGHHGPVRVSDRYHYRYADGTRYINIGTTAYAWNHQGDATEEQTLATLADAPFTKIRMCVFPKHYRYNQNEPDRYPFPLVTKGSSAWPGSIKDAGWEFDYERFEPEYFQHLEKRINQLAEIGVEADLIIFHPYDRWGFSHMTPEQDDRYLRYLTARLAALPNVWWSMANEYDLMPNKSPADWDRFIHIVSDNDPYGHLLSNHNCFAFFDHNHPRITHSSIQRSSANMAALWREKYGKPVSIDECCYEGDISELWGNISGQKLVRRFWDGTVNGGYVTHGETYYNDEEVLWWAKGGKLVGESVARIAFLRRILEEGPDEGLDPIQSTTAYRIQMQGGLDNVQLQQLFGTAPGEEGWPRVTSWWATAGQPHRYYLSYLGENQPHEYAVAVPPAERYSATLIDTWEMTETPLADSVQRGDLLHFDPKPYLAILLKRIED
ncbi:hypothetical protein GGR20_000863 [Devosia subaequoris]|uniref:DUF5060 domain-containing protein n=1 Tax=Devosia subaequoris TaxID=395930 RepID=A0A7W6IKI4_9HYPH|nr:DUF5060 domain-containing protein [Devosia subaequoris]MBB4051245.1 hypothetical protein [Devosia subaequoris]MCP1208091.1 DUF5060 domain-containing protein [Devosia subaequoris]